MNFLWDYKEKKIIPYWVPASIIILHQEIYSWTHYLVYMDVIFLNFWNKVSNGILLPRHHHKHHSPSSWPVFCYSWSKNTTGFFLTEAIPYISFKTWQKNSGSASSSQKQHIISYPWSQGEYLLYLIVMFFKPFLGMRLETPRSSLRDH